VSKLSVNVESFKPLRSNTLFGFADILIPELHLRIRQATVHESHGKRTLFDTFMNTRFGGRQRRHFLMKRWITFGGGLPEAAAPALSAVPSAPTATKEAPNRSATTDKPSGFRTVEPPALKEETGDSIPW
jgi:hypothetical protein